MVMVQIRNMPGELHRRLKSKAALLGMSLSDYLLGVVEREASTLTIAELNAELDALGPVEVGPSFSAAELIREARAEREEHLMGVLGHGSMPDDLQPDEAA